jgi:hypothetical protein
MEKLHYDPGGPCLLKPNGSRWRKDRMVGAEKSAMYDALIPLRLLPSNDLTQVPYM